MQNYAKFIYIMPVIIAFKMNQIFKWIFVVNLFLNSVKMIKFNKTLSSEKVRFPGVIDIITRIFPLFLSSLSMENVSYDYYIHTGLSLSMF